jgi:flagellar biosynthesis GTPase FlhF
MRQVNLPSKKYISYVIDSVDYWEDRTYEEYRDYYDEDVDLIVDSLKHSIDLGDSMSFDIFGYKKPKPKKRRKTRDEIYTEKIREEYQQEYNDYLAQKAHDEASIAQINRERKNYYKARKEREEHFAQLEAKQKEELAQRQLKAKQKEELAQRQKELYADVASRYGKIKGMHKYTYAQDKIMIEIYLSEIEQLYGITIDRENGELAQDLYHICRKTISKTLPITIAALKNHLKLIEQDSA